MIKIKEINKYKYCYYCNLINFYSNLNKSNE